MNQMINEYNIMMVHRVRLLPFKHQLFRITLKAGVTYGSRFEIDYRVFRNCVAIIAYSIVRLFGSYIVLIYFNL